MSVSETHDLEHLWTVIGAKRTQAGVIGPNDNKRVWYSTEEEAVIAARTLADLIAEKGNEIELAVVKAVVYISNNAMEKEVLKDYKSV